MRFFLYNENHLLEEYFCKSWIIVNLIIGNNNLIIGNNTQFQIIFKAISKESINKVISGVFLHALLRTRYF